jgi:hypothetical protein
LCAIALQWLTPAVFIALANSRINMSSSPEAPTGTQYDTQAAATVEYVGKHKIQELLSHLLQLVVYAKPEDPRAFMADEVLKMQQTEEKPSCLFADEELDMMFELVDVTRQKTISVKQLRNAYANLSYDVDSSVLEDDKLPASVVETGRVTRDEFKTILGGQLRTRNHWQH